MKKYDLDDFEIDVDDFTDAELALNLKIYTAMTILMAQELKRHRKRGTDSQILAEYYEAVAPEEE